MTGGYEGAVSILARLSDLNLSQQQSGSSGAVEEARKDRVVVEK
jgi:hypothetical protein